ncbi:MAG: SsrA RNA (tmRNA)-binding protein [uncultured bacterium]|nr:MAG: SsrA RNA (tmRNA)-binding protein [uncultured bacterium]KKT01899.1 MAG: ssrA RNA (tmRNA)-binding protein, SsrA-binding protein [Candidatus Peregrinibacteria bacterium GW2011_GWF2_43_17]HAU39553.1 SsrA-binding protein [Candidatus Peregrinibacteria bacterium]
MEPILNKKALHDYEVLNKLEAGLILAGHEAKSIRNGGATLKGSYITIKNSGIFTQNLSISRYKYASITDYDPKRPRQLLLSKKEIEYLTSQENQKGVTIIPLDIHFKNNFAKMTIGICRGKKLYDKRVTLKKKADDLEIKHALKKFNR